MAFGAALGANAGENVDGEWARDDGQVRTLIAPCGGNICAASTRAKNAQDDERVGDKLVMTLKEREGRSGKALALIPSAIAAIRWN